MADKDSESTTPELAKDLEQATMDDKKKDKHNTVVEAPDIQRPLAENEDGDEMQRKERKNTEKKSPQNDFPEEGHGSEEKVVRPKDEKNTDQDEEACEEDLPDERHLYEYFWRKHSVFSQQHTCEFVVDGITYNSAEQYMMHQKAGNYWLANLWRMLRCALTHLDFNFE